MHNQLLKKFQTLTYNMINNRAGPTPTEFDGIAALFLSLSGKPVPGGQDISGTVQHKDPYNDNFSLKTLITRSILTS